jgi:hypothetical protein
MSMTPILRFLAEGLHVGAHVLLFVTRNSWPACRFHDLTARWAWPEEEAQADRMRRHALELHAELTRLGGELIGAVEAEREACAVLVAGYPTIEGYRREQYHRDMAMVAAIRARGR